MLGLMRVYKTFSCKKNTKILKTEKGNTNMRIKLVLSFVLFVSALNIDLHAITVDIYQNMESGSDGDQLTIDIMDASCYGGYGDFTATWYFYSGDDLWVSNNYARELPGQVIVGGINRNVSGNRTWRFFNRLTDQQVAVKFASNGVSASSDRVTIACFYTCNLDTGFNGGAQYDNIIMGCNPSGYAVLQTWAPYKEPRLFIRAHSEDSSGTTHSPTMIEILREKTYWVNLHQDGIVGECKIAVFDPDTWEELESSPIVAESKPHPARSRVAFGRGHHGDFPVTETYAYFDHIMVDITNAAFPLVPDNVQIQSSNDKKNTLHPYIIFYPNQSKGNYSLQVTNLSPVLIAGTKLQIYDISGMLIDELPVVNGKFFWDNASVSAGTYVMRLAGTKNYLCQTLFIMR